MIKDYPTVVIFLFPASYHKTFFKSITPKQFCILINIPSLIDFEGYMENLCNKSICIVYIDFS